MVQSAGAQRGGKGAQLPGRRITLVALKYCEGAKKSQLCHTYILQYSTFASGRPQVRKWGRRTCILPRAPSNLVTPLTIWRLVASRNPSIHFNETKRTATKFQGLEKKRRKIRTVCVNYIGYLLPLCKSIYFRQFFCLHCIQTVF